MTFLKRCCLVVFFLQIGCLALDHSISELEYEEDEIRLLVGNNYPTESITIEEPVSEDENGQSAGNEAISFHPRVYDFKECPVGMPRLGVVRLDNRLTEETLKLISISGNTVNFHSSFFADKVIGPGNTTTFEVVFLSREEGLFESLLYIHTSKGLFKYQVRGVGLPNPYRLRPLVGATIPVNASYEPVITLHNPHNTRILVVEMLSSGTDFSLRLPDEVDEQEEGTAWAIEPFQTKPVMQGSFQGKTEGNHTGFIRIKVNHTAVTGEYLMVPVEVQVSSSPGIYSPQGSLDFGLLVRSDKPKTLSLNLINAQATPVNVQSVAVKGEPNAAVRIEFRPVVIEPDISASTVVALITFDAPQSTLEQTSGFIEVRSDCGKSISIPFQATVLEGELEYNASSLGFFHKADHIPPRNFSVRNNFSSAVAIYQVSVNHPDIVQVDNLNQSHVITPGEQKTIFTLKVQKKAELCDSKSAVQLTVKSNITNLRLPITCYDGRLELHSAEQGQLDFGRVELYSTYTEYFSVENKNPIEIRLKSWGSNSSWSQVELVGMQKGVKEDLARIRDFDNLKKSLFLQPGHMAVFSIDIRRPTVEGMAYGESYVTTDHNQTLRVPFRFLVSKGSVHSDPILFDRAFPSKISFEKLYLSSTFNHSLNLLGLRSYPSSIVWFSSSTLQGYPEISPHRRNFVGKVHFDPHKFCSDSCYSGFSLESELGKEWLKGTVLNWETGEIDSRIWDTLQNRFRDVKDGIVSNVSLWVDTSGPTGFKMKAQVKYVWPRLSTTKMLAFPLTALGNETLMDIGINNPSNFPVIVQLALSQQYGPSWTNFIHGNSVGGNSTEGGLVFSINEVSSSSSHSNVSGLLGEAQTKLENTSFPGAVFLLQPGAKLSLSLKFKPISKEMASSLLLLRNNLTGIETVWLRGRAGTGQLTVGNGTPGSTLLFQLTEKLLQACENESTSKYVPPQLTVRRSFLARNVGEIPLDILSLEIYPPQGSLWSMTFGYSTGPVDACEGYGFRILNCHPFTLQPNQTHSVDIAFTPDFTLSKVVRSLRLTDSTGGHFNYTLVSLIPSGMLTICASIIARPSWEPYLKYLLAFGAVICILVVAMMSYFEAGSVVSSTVLATVRVMPSENGVDGCQDDIREKTHRLDLKAVVGKVENRIRNQQERQKQGLTSNKFQKSTDVNVQSANGNLRNRKTKKGSNEVTISQLMNNKFTDNIFQNNLTRSNSSLNSVDNCIVSNYMSSNTCTGKKDKEKENVGYSTNPVGKKKRNGSTGTTSQNQQNAQFLKQKKLQNKNDNYTNVSFQEKSKQRAEEETSSTTTESSNPDDFILPYSEKEKKRYNKGTPANEGKNKANRKEKRESKNETSSNENISSSTEMLAGKDSEAPKKKPFTKKRELGEATTNVHTVSGSTSPKQEMSLWDTPRPPSGDGFSELAAQTEAFGLHRPNKRNNSGGDQSGNAFGMCGTMGGMISGSHMNTNIGQGSHPLYATQQQLRPKKPGVIGQPRLNHNNMPSLGSNVSHSMSPTIPPLSGFPPGMSQFPTSTQNSIPGLNMSSGINSRQYSPTERTIPNLKNGSGSIWESDILPDNGCDIWGRRSLDGTGVPSSFLNNRTDNSFSRGSNLNFGNGRNYSGSQNPFGELSNTMSESHYPKRASPKMKTSKPAMFPNAMNGLAGAPNYTGGLPSRTGEPYLLNGGLTNELLQNLWQINSSSFGESSQAYTAQPSFANGQQHQPIQQQSQFNMNTTTSGGISQHGYLQRMRSDPTLRSQPRATGGLWADSSYSTDNALHHRGNSTVQRSSEMPTSHGNAHWLPTATSSTSSGGGASLDTSYAEWRAVGQTAGRLAENESQIWENGIGLSSSGRNKWPSSYENTQNQNTFSESMAVGSGSRAGLGNRQEDTNAGVSPLADLGLRGPSTDMTQNLREVEAGLGFNPFTSDIWNQGEGPSWSSSYRYPSNE